MEKATIYHPYLPKDVILPVEYVSNKNSLLEIVGGFFFFVFLLLVFTFVYASRRPQLTLPLATKLKICWFVACAFIHIVLEAYFSVFWKKIAGDQSFLSQLWKEYSKGDSRYVSGDTFTVCMEMITGFVDGPLAIWAAWGFLNRKPCRFVAQLLVSVCQLYGDVLYFMTAYKEGFKHGPMGHPVYFWFYFVFMNFIWIVIPSILVVQSVKKLTRAQAISDSRYPTNKSSKSGNNKKKSK